MTEVGNLHEGRVARHAALVVPSVLAALSLAGVAVRPNLSLRAAALELDQAELRVIERQQNAGRLQGLRAEGGLERVQRLLAAVQKLVPAPLPELELHALVRLIAERQGVVLAVLELREPGDPGLEHLDDVALLREVRLEGTSTLEGLFGLLGSLRELGRSVAVRELRVARAEHAEHYAWSTVIGLFEAHPAPAPSSEVAQGEAREEGGQP